MPMLNPLGHASSLLTPGPAIILRSNANDNFYATFTTIESRDAFFKEHYTDRMNRRYEQLKQGHNIPN